MNISIDNINTNNKGAELMLYAVLQELERKHPDAVVHLPLFRVPKMHLVKTSMNCKQRRVGTIAKIFKKLKGVAVMEKIFNIPCPYYTDFYPIKGLDIVLDAGGFRFSDQFIKSSQDFTLLNNYYKYLKKQNTKIIFLPQAFGPFDTDNGKKQTKILEKYIDIIYARDETSLSHLINAGIHKSKIFLYPDFTALVKGEFPANYDHLKNGIAIIPNMKMIDQGILSRQDYINEMVKIINICNSKYTTFLINHEGKGDLKLCREIAEVFNNKLPVLGNLSSLEIKGIISQCYFVFSSRYHGVASALSSGVPCFASSWSHKYKMLFKDFGMEDCIFNNIDDHFYSKMNNILDNDNNKLIRNKLIIKSNEIKEKNKEMWENIWKIT